MADVIQSAGPRSVYDAVVSSQFDADRLDYIRRDRMMAGSSHGVIDYDWLVSNLEIGSVTTGVDEQQVADLQTFVIGPKGVHATEAYVLGLFQLYPTIYLHKTTRGIEKLFTELMVRVFELAREGHESKVGLCKSHPLLHFVADPTNIDRALCLDDSVIYGALSQFCEAKDRVISEFSQMIRDRSTFKCFDIREYIRKKMSIDSADAEARKALDRASLSCLTKIELWKKTSGKTMVLKDETSRSPYKRFEESKGPLNQIMVRSPAGGLVDIGEYSPIVASIPRFEVLRYYVDRDSGDFDTLCKIVDEEIGHGI